jgi:hypothetical protein
MSVGGGIRQGMLGLRTVHFYCTTRAPTGGLADVMPFPTQEPTPVLASPPLVSAVVLPFHV